MGHDELLIASPELQTRLGQKYCDEAGLLPLLLAHGIVRRVRTIEVTVQPLGGDNFTIKLNAAEPSVGEAKAEIARTQGTSEARQELSKVAVRADGCAVREDDADPEPLDDDAIELGDGETVTMVVKEEPWVWRTFDEEKVALSEGGAVATTRQLLSNYNRKLFGSDTLVTSDVVLTEGKHYWEIMYATAVHIPLLYIGVTRPNLNPTGNYAQGGSTDGWFIGGDDSEGGGAQGTQGGGTGNLYGNGKEGDDDAGSIDEGDRVGVLLDLDEGSLRFFKNDVQHGPGYPAGSVTGPVVCAVQLYHPKTSVRLLPQDADHALLK
jgi:hypothetical protein